MARIQERYRKDDSRLAVTAQFLGRREQARQSRLLSKSAAGLTAGTATVTSSRREAPTLLSHPETTSQALESPGELRRASGMDV